MTDKYIVWLTPHAEESLEDIAMYIAIDLKEPDIAIKYIKRLKEEIETLSNMPNRIKLVDIEPWHSQGVHQMTAERFYVYFWIDETNGIVSITDIIAIKRDQKKALKKMSMQ